MQVVYFFCTSRSIHVPFFDFDKRVFGILSALRGGVWDRVKQEFVFKRTDNGTDFDREQFTQVINTTPTVWVEPNAPPKVCGFLDRAWHITVKELYVKTEKSIQNRLNFISTDKDGGTLPEMLGDMWKAKLDNTMRARKYSDHTRRTYHYYNALLCKKIQKTPEEMDEDDITLFLAQMEKKGDYSASTMNLAISAIKFFYKNVVKVEIAQEQYRPRQDKKVPTVLSKREIIAMFETEKNIKHRILLMIIYASGLRVSEAVCLKRRDLDTDRRTLTVTGGKGRKGRTTALADTVTEILADYYRIYGDCGDGNAWLFPGYDGKDHITARTAQHIFEKAMKNTNIQKKASIHSLRHSYATHHLEAGTDIVCIRDLLGHSSVSTTERYTHVARRRVLKIKSPLDRLREPD